MAGGIDWFRWHHGAVTDPKFQLVARKAGTNLASVIAVWAFVLEKASSAEFRGCFGELDVEAIDCLFGLDDGTTDAILGEMVVRKLIADEFIVSWEKRQPKREREDATNADRQRTFKAKENQVTPSNAKQNQLTPSNTTDNQKTPRGEESREEKRRVEKKNTGGDARATRLPAHQALPDDWREFCKTERPDLIPLATYAKFADYWTAKPGKAGTKLDWLATWRNWVREEKVKPQARASPESFRERDSRLARERMAQLAPGVAQRMDVPFDWVDEVKNVLAIASY
jgi:hypothetical protein